RRGKRRGIMNARKKSVRVISSAAAIILFACVVAILHGQGFSFLFLVPGYSQHLFGVTSPKSANLGGVVVLQNGDVITLECRMNGTNLHHFDASTTYTDPTGTVLHPEIMPVMSLSAGGCGIALGTDGFLYSNMNDGTFGVAKISLTTGVVAK